VSNSDLGALLAWARPQMASFFANPPEGLCSGANYHASALACLDQVIREGAGAPDKIRLEAVHQARQWMGKIIADMPEGKCEVGVAAYAKWEACIRKLPTAWRP